MPAAPASRHLAFEELAPGVWAALHRPGGWAVGNAGIVDLGGTTLLFDTTITALAARELGAAAERLTGRPADVVVLSHYHNDHVRGAEVFEGATVMATDRTREAIDTLGRDELASDREHAESRLEQVRALAAGSGPEAASCRTMFVPYWEALAASAPAARLRLPDVTFHDRATFHGTRRRAELRSLGHAHTVDDAVLHLPDDGIVFCADLLFVHAHPYLGDGDPEGWLRALADLGRLDARRYVPGHGPVGTRSDVDALDRHIRELLATAARLRAHGATPEEVDAARPEGEASSWAFAFPFHAANLRFLTRRDA